MPATTSSRAPCSEIDLLGKRQSVVDLDAEVADGALQLTMAEQELAGPQITGLLVHQSDLRSPQAVSAIGPGLQVDQGYPLVDQPRVLARAEMLAGSAAARKEPVVVPRAPQLQPGRERLACRIGDLEGYRSARLLLDDRCMLPQRAAGRHVADPQLA